MNYFAALVAFSLANGAYGHGEDAKPVPKLSPETLAAIGQVAPAEAPVAATTQTAATCFEGFTLYSDGSCVKEIDEPAIPRVGEVTVPFLIQCPAGYTPEGHECARTTSATPNYFCPVGYTDDGAFCTAQPTATLPAKVCNVGQLIGSQCITTVNAPYIVTPECPDGSKVEEDGGCWKIIETFDCTPQEGKNGRAIAASRPSSGLAAGTHLRVEKSHTPLLRTKLQEPAHVPRSTAPSAPLSTTPLGLPKPTAVHPPHYELLAQDSKGRRAIHRALGVKKALRHSKNEVVVGPLSKGPALVNPVPAFPFAIPEPTLAPAAGPAFPNAAILEGGEALPDDCVKDLVSVSAPHAYKVGIATQSCFKKTQVDALALVSCPEEYYDDGTGCVREIATEPSLACTDGSPAVDGLCTGPISRIPKIQKCADGTLPVNGQCLLVDLVPGKKLCGPGFTDVGSGCSAVVTTGGPAFECPEGLTLQGDRCIGVSVRPAVAITMTADVATCSK